MKLLVTGVWQASLEELESIRQLGHEIVFLQQEKDPLPCPYKDIEGCICNGLFLYHPIEKFRSLRYIQLTSAGFDRVPMEYVKAHNIEIHNACGVYSVPMAEFALCGVLQLYKQSGFFRENQRIHRWEKHRGLRELAGKTVFIAGCGSVGNECAKHFAAFNCEVIGFDIAAATNPAFQRIEAISELDAQLPLADILVLTLPLTASTHHLLNPARFAKMKTGAVLVNISRGAVVDENALTDWLSQSPENGAVLDVFESEPLPETSPLWAMKNALVTPHNSFVSEGNGERLYTSIKNFLEKTEIHAQSVNLC